MTLNDLPADELAELDAAIAAEQADATAQQIKENEKSDRKWCDWVNRQLELNYENMRNWLDDKLPF
jgi:hypothetical protein